MREYGTKMSLRERGGEREWEKGRGRKGGREGERVREGERKKVIKHND